MARLAYPPTISRLSCGTAKPAARRAPIQSAASTTKASIVARPSLSISAATRTHNLRVAWVAVQVARSAPVSAVASRTNEGACLKALREVTMVRKKMAKSKQAEVGTRIPGPKTTNVITKWAKSRQYKAVVSKEVIEDKKDETKHALEVAEKAKIAVTFEDQDKNIECEESQVVIYIDNNPELLNDVSFDADIECDQQSSYQSQTKRFDELFDTQLVGDRIASCPAYGGGDSFTLRHKRPKVVEVRFASCIPRIQDSTLKYGGMYLLISRVMIQGELTSCQ
jgi:hypothetical protein